MKVYCDVRGRGPNLFLVHGWGMHSGIWDSVHAALTARFRVTRVDLPGHGRSGWHAPDTRLATLGTLAHVLLDVAPPRAVWLGWSLGGMAVMRAALLEPGRVARLVVVSSTPRFVAGDDWPCGMHPAALQLFADQLTADYRGVVQNFLTLQARGDERSRAVLRELRQSVFAQGEPDPGALAAGLRLLRDADLREDLADIAAPALVIAGEHDRVTPPEAGRRLAAALPDARFTVIGQAGHAPFVSHPNAFLRALCDFAGVDPAPRTESPAADP